MRGPMRNKTSVRKQILDWLDDHDEEFTSAQLAALFNKSAKTCSTEICLLRKEGVITIATDDDGKIKMVDGHTYVFKKGTGEVRTYERKPRSPEKPKLQPGWLGITIHTLDGGIEITYA